MYYNLIKRACLMVTICVGVSFLTSCTNQEKEFYENGALKMESDMYLGKKHGATKTYHENGNVATYTMYNHGLRDGDTIAFYASGIKAFEGKYRDDIADSTATYYWEDGKLHTILNHKNGALNGPFFRYYPKSGIVFMKGKYLDGRVVDTLEIFTNRGIKVRECYFSRTGEERGCKDF